MGKHRLTDKGVASMVKRLRKFLDKALKEVDNLHVIVQPGNKKTGPNCWTISLLPVIDCICDILCPNDCYDLKSDTITNECAWDRARNSAIHKVDPVRFWSEIDAQIKANFIMELRINVGGDLTKEDFWYVAELGRNNPRTMIIFFTKNYDGINEFLDIDSFPDNVHPIMSAWKGMEMRNPHNLPLAHVIWKDGTTTAPEFGAYLCTNNCSECAFWDKGCWALQKGQHVAFLAH